MDVRVVHFAVAVLLSVYTGQGEAQVDCYPDSSCNEDALFNNIEPIACCEQGASIAYQGDGDGERCTLCYVYGWLGDFPRMVKKGDVLPLAVGYIKGGANIRRRVTVRFNSNEVMVNVTTTFTLSNDATFVEVTVLNDGLPVTEDVTITLTLEYDSVGTDEIFRNTAQLVIPAQIQEKPVQVELTNTGLVVDENGGDISICVSATNLGSREILVSLSATPGTADVDDFSFSPITLKMNANQTMMCVDVLMIRDDLHEFEEDFTILLTTLDDNVNVTNAVTSITILDADEAVILLEPASDEVMEGDKEGGTLCLSLDNSEVSVNITLSGGNQFAGDVDLRLREFVTLHPDGMQCLQYVVVDDDEIEGTEEVEWTWEGVESSRVQPATFRLTILDNDELPPIPPPDLPPDDTLADVVTGGALLTSLINARSKDSDTPLDMSLCYEIHGQPGKYFNYISGQCLSVNTHYIISTPDRPLNNINEIDVVATNGLGENVYMSVDTECTLSVNGSSEIIRYINDSGLVVQVSSSVVVISTDNAFCGGERVDLVVYCGSTEYGVLRLHVHRDLVLRESYHGLLGQFWSRLIFIQNFGIDPLDYLIEISQSDDQTKQLVGSDHSVTWQRRKQRCLYAGDRQGAKGAGQHGGPNEPLIDGVYTDYIVDGPFDTSFAYSQFGQ